MQAQCSVCVLLILFVCSMNEKDNENTDDNKEGEKDKEEEEENVVLSPTQAELMTTIVENKLGQIHWKVTILVNSQEHLCGVVTEKVKSENREIVMGGSSRKC